jgi:hypothetical protein
LLVRAALAASPVPGKAKTTPKRSLWIALIGGFDETIDAVQQFWSMLLKVWYADSALKSCRWRMAENAKSLCADISTK